MANDFKLPGFGDLLGKMTDLKGPPPAPPPQMAPAAPSILTGAAPPPPKLESKKNADPETMAQIQSMVWGNGNHAPVQPAPAAQANIGQAPSMNKSEGWGKI